MKITKDILMKLSKEEVIDLYLEVTNRSEIKNQLNAYKDQKVFIKQKFKETYYDNNRTQYMYTFNIVNNVLYSKFQRYVPSGYGDGNPGSSGSKQILLDEEKMKMILEYGFTKETIRSIPEVKRFMRSASNDFSLSSLEKIEPLKIKKQQTIKKPKSRSLAQDNPEADEIIDNINQSKDVVNPHTTKKSKFDRCLNRSIRTAGSVDIRTVN